MSVLMWQEWGKEIIWKEVVKVLPEETVVKLLVSELPPSPVMERGPFSDPLTAERRCKVKVLAYPADPELGAFSTASVFDMDLFELAPNPFDFLRRIGRNIGAFVAGKFEQEKERKKPPKDKNHLTEEELRNLTKMAKP